MATLFKPRKLRHRIDIERPIDRQDKVTGLSKIVWEKVHSNVPAEIVPSSVREFISSQAQQSQIVARIVIRAREGLTADMRIIHKDKIYNPEGWLPDADSGLLYVTAPCSQGVNKG